MYIDWYCSHSEVSIEISQRFPLEMESISNLLEMHPSSNDLPWWTGVVSHLFLNVIQPNCHSRII